MAGLELLRFALALGFVLGLIALLAWFARRMRWGGIVSAAGERRLALLEATVIDQRHKVVLVRRDDVEHLLLLGPASSVLIESRAAPSDPKPPERPTPRPLGENL